MAVLVTIAGAVIIGLILVELFFRTFVAVIDVPFVFWDPVVGLRRGPNQAGRMILGRSINARYRFNSQGWNHERDYVIDKPKNEVRICLVGDSQVEAYQVDVDKTMYAQAERLMSRPGRPVEWYAFGCSGFGTSQEYQVIHHYALDYSPDLVVLMFVENDPHDSSPYVFPVENFLSTYYLGDDGDVVLMPPRPWHPTWYRRFGAASAMVRYFTIQKRLLAEKPSPHVAGGVYLREGVFSQTNIHRVPGMEKLSADERQARTWLLIERILELTRDECRRRGSRFAVVFRGSTPVLQAVLKGETYTPPPRAEDPYCLGTRLFEMGKEYLEPITRKLGIPYTDLTEPIRQLVIETKKPHVYLDDGHWNEATHAVAAKVLSVWAESILKEPAAK